MHFIHIDRGIDRFYVGENLSARMLHAQGERVADVLYHLIQVYLFLLQNSLLAVVHGHLQHFLYQEPQAFALVVDDASQMGHHGFALGDTLVVQHLGRQRNACDGCLQFVGHVVDEVVFDFRITFLAEDDHYRKDEGHQQHESEDNAGDHELHRREDVAAHVGEMDSDDAHLCRRVVSEQRLRIGVFFSVGGIIRTTINLTPVLRADREVVGDVHPVVYHLGLQVLVEQLEVDSFLQRLVAGGIENRVDHLVEQSFLIDVSVLDYFLKRLRGFGNGVLVAFQNHGLGALCRSGLYGLELKGRIDGAVLAGHRERVRLLYRPVWTQSSRTRSDGIPAKSLALRLVHVFLQIA